MFFDPKYFLFVGPALLFGMWASWRVRRAFDRYSDVPVSTGMTGAEAAYALLERAGVNDCRIEMVDGYLTDHYNPMTKTLGLSPKVYGERSIAAIGVATHEAGHAIQHAHNYGPLWLRSALVPMAGIGSNLGLIVMAIGAAMSGAAFGKMVVLIGALLFSLVLLFQIVTLPVEFNATARAKQMILDAGIIRREEKGGVDAVLNAAAMTYVAAAMSTLSTLLYYLWRAGIIGGGRSDD